MNRVPVSWEKECLWNHRPDKNVGKDRLLPKPWEGHREGWDGDKSCSSSAGECRQDRETARELELGKQENQKKFQK